jgi:hypothetical protein
MQPEDAGTPESQGSADRGTASERGMKQKGKTDGERGGRG